MPGTSGQVRVQGSGGTSMGVVGLCTGAWSTSGQSHLSHVASCRTQDSLAARVEPFSVPPPSPEEPYYDPGQVGASQEKDHCWV